MSPEQMCLTRLPSGIRSLKTNVEIVSRKMQTGYTRELGGDYETLNYKSWDEGHRKP